MNKRDRRLLKRIKKLVNDLDITIIAAEPEPEYSQHDKSFAEYMDELAKTYGVI